MDQGPTLEEQAEDMLALRERFRVLYDSRPELARWFAENDPRATPELKRYVQERLRQTRAN